MSLGPIGPIPPPASTKSSVSTITGTSGGAIGPNSVGNVNLTGTNISITGDPLTNTLTFTGVGGSGTASSSFTTNSGSAAPNNSGVINVVGDTTTGVTTSGSGNTLTISGVVATQTQEGVTRFATNADAINGGSATVSVTPAALLSKLGTLLMDGIPIGQGSTSALSWLAPLLSGQLLGGSTGAAPVPTTLTAGPNIAITSQPGTITITGSGTLSSAYTLFGNTGSATAVGGNTNIVGDPNVLTTTGSGQTLTISVVAPILVSYGGTGQTSLNAHGVLVGEGTSAVTTLAVGTNGQVLIGGTGADPAFAAITSTGNSLISTTSSHGLNIDIKAPVVVSYGGTGQTSLNTHGVLVGEGTAAITTVAVGTNGQVLIGAAGADPAFATITSSGGSILFTYGANTLNMESALSTITLKGNAGTASVLGGSVSVVGDAQTITTTGSGSSLTISLISPVLVSYGGTGQTNLNAHGVLVGEGSSPITTVAVGTNGQVLIGAGSADPAFATITSSGGSILFTYGANTLNMESALSTITLKGNAGTASVLGGSVSVVGDAQTITTTGSGSSLTISLISPVLVSYGGTGQTDLNAHGVLIGEGSSPITTVAVGTNGQVLIGAGGADPAFATITSTGGSLAYAVSANGLNIDINAPVLVSYGGTGQTDLNAHGVLVGEGSSAVTTLAVGTNGQVLIGAGGADPAFATITSTGGSIVFSYGTNTLNMETATGGLWTEVTGTFQQMSPSNGYIANNGSQVELLLPSVSALGTLVRVSGKGAGGWKVSQTVSQIIHFGTHDTTTGLAGSISSTATRDSIELLCVVADTEWNVLSGVGNMSYS